VSELGEGMWAILEIMGHRRLGGFVREVEVAGCKMLRIDVPGVVHASGVSLATTQFYGASSIFCLTPTSEEIARRVAQASQPTPVHPFELPAADTRGSAMGRSASGDENAAPRHLWNQCDSYRRIIDPVGWAAHVASCSQCATES